MPFTINWYIENEVAYIHYSGVTSPAELKESLLTVKGMVDNSTRHLVHVISDVGDVTDAVAPIDSLKIIREVGTSERSGWNIILREKSALIKLGIAISTTALKSRNRAFATLEAAEAFLKEMDPGLSWDKADKSNIVA